MGEVSQSILATIIAPAVIAALITQVVLWLRDRQSKTVNAKLSAIRVVFIAETFANACSAAVEESMVYYDTEGSRGQVRLEIPALPEYPEEVDWAALGPDLTYAALDLKIGIEQVQAIYWQEDLSEISIQQIKLSTTAGVGLEALELADRLRSRFELPQMNRNSELSSYSILKRASGRFG